MVGIYIRVSTLNQSSGLSSQQNAILGYCAIKNIVDYGIYSDEGFSGGKVSRPGLDKLMADVKSGHITQVIVYSFSRFARSLRHLLSALDIFRELQIDFISVTENLDTSTPLGRTIFQIIGSIAELEKSLIKERVLNGLENARKNGKKLGRQKTRNSELIRELAEQEYSYRKIAKLARCSRTTVMRELKSTVTNTLSDNNEDQSGLATRL